MTFDSHKRNENSKKNIRQEMLNLNAFTVICGGWVFEFFSKKFCSQRTEHNSQIENAFEMCNTLFSGAGGSSKRGRGKGCHSAGCFSQGFQFRHFLKMFNTEAGLGGDCF